MSLPAIHACPGTLAEGFSSYSPACLRNLFNGKKVSHILPFASAQASEESGALFIENRQRISISGVQEKLSLRLEKNRLRLTKPGEHGLYLLKPIPRDVKHVAQVPANEHLTMQIARVPSAARREFSPELSYPPLRYRIPITGGNDGPHNSC